MSMATKAGEWSSVQRPSKTSSGVRRSGLSYAARDTRRQKFSSAARAPSAALVGIAVDQHRGIHRSRRRAGDTVDAQPRLLEQAVEHAPREGAMRAPALQGEVHYNRGTVADACHHKLTGTIAVTAMSR